LKGKKGELTPFRRRIQTFTGGDEKRRTGLSDKRRKGKGEGGAVLASSMKKGA